MTEAAAPAFNAVEGPSFPVAIKVLATLAVGTVLLAAWSARAELAAIRPGPELLLLAGLAGAVVLWHFASILMSRTGISSDALWQGWLWRTTVPLRDIAQVKLLRIQRLDGFVAPRLVVRTRALGSVTFHAADPAVLAVIDVLVHGQADTHHT
jgi:hypothetical protein